MEGTFNMKQRIFEYFIFVPQHSINSFSSISYFFKSRTWTWSSLLLLILETGPIPRIQVGRLLALGLLGQVLLRHDSQVDSLRLGDTELLRLG